MQAVMVSVINRHYPDNAKAALLTTFVAPTGRTNPQRYASCTVQFSHALASLRHLFHIDKTKCQSEAGHLILSHYHTAAASHLQGTHASPRAPMSSHSNCDLQQPPPSAQRSSWAPPADVRSDGTARRRPIARHRDEIPSSKGDGVARMAKNTASPSRAMTIANPSVEQRPSTTQSDHIPSSRMNTSTKCGNGKAQPLQSSTSSSAVANPTRTVFDPWNSASTGHQRAENRLLGSTSWRDSRNLKLREQYRGGLGGGGKRVADTVGAGSEECGKDGRKANGGWERGAKGLRTGRQRSLVEVWGASKVGSAKRSSQEEKEVKLEEARSESESGDGLDDDMATNEGMFKVMPLVVLSQSHVTAS